MRYSAVLFDMDGVVIDTHHAVTAFWERLAERHHIHLSAADFTQHIYGTPATHTLAVCFPNLSADARQGVLDDLIRYEDQQVYQPVNGVVAFLGELQRHHIRTALVTSADPRKVRTVFDQLGIDGMFSAVVTADDVKRGKPDPQCYLLGAERVQRAPEQCVVFEDALSGVKAAVAAGTTCVGVQHAARSQVLLDAGAGGIVPDFAAVTLEAAAAGTVLMHLTAGQALMMQPS